MPIRNWGGGGDYSDTFIALQDEFMRRAQEAKAARSGGSGGGGRRSGGGGARTARASGGNREDAGVIIDGMSRGTTNWRNLYAFYQKQLRGLPRNSPIRSQVQRQISNIELVAEANGISLAGGTAPTTVAEAEPGTNRYSKKDDITPSVDAAINDQILFLMATRNGVYPGNERPLASYAGRMIYEGSVGELRDGMIADAKLQEEMLTDIKNGATQVLDPVSGQYLTVDPTFSLNLIYQYNENQMALAGLERGLGSEGDFAQRIATWEGVQDALIAPIITTKVFPATDSKGNAAAPDVKGIADYMDQQMVHFNVLKNIALQSSDPADVLKNLRAAGLTLSRSMKDVKSIIGNLPEGFEVEDYVNEDIDFSIKLADFLKTTSSMTAEEAMTAGANLLESHPGEGYFLSRSDVEELVGGYTDEVGSVGEKGAATEGRVSPGWHGVGGALAAIDGINNGITSRSGGEPRLDTEAYVYVAPFGQSSPVAVPAGQAREYLQALSGNELFDQGLSAGAIPSIENIKLPNGRTQATVVWREMQAPSEEDITWWSKEVNGKTVWATQAQFEQFGGDRLLAARMGWQPAPFAGLEDIYTVMGADGQTYYVRGSTKQVYVNQPIDLPLGGEFHFTDLLNQDGSVSDKYNYVKFNGDIALTGPGVDYKIAQQVALGAIQSGEIDLNDYKWMNESGVPLNTPTLDEVAQSFIPPLSYWLGAYHEDLRRNLAKEQKQKYFKARLEQYKAREFNVQQHLRMDRQLGLNPSREDYIPSFEVAARRTGIRFIDADQRAPSFYTEPIDVPERRESAIPPVTLDAVRPPRPAVMPGIDDVPRPKPVAPPAPKPKQEPYVPPRRGGVTPR